MMRSAATLFLALFMSHARTQVLCDTLPITYDPVNITFTTSDMSFGDSVMVLNVTNTSTTSMAYPQVKLVPLTALPPGMVMNTEWSVFASSWNPEQTMPASIFFDVTLPIPQDFTVTFQVWATNLTPLLVDDSCVFDQTFTINLNPSGTGIAGGNGSRTFSVWPMPTSDLMHVGIPITSSPSRLAIIDATGVQVGSFNVAAGSQEATIPVGRFATGAYQLILWSSGRVVHGCRIAVMH